MEGCQLQWLVEGNKEEPEVAETIAHLIEYVDGQAVACWHPPHEVRNPDLVDSIYESMDSDPTKFVWDGPPLVADINAGQLYTGTHRQAAIQRITETYGPSWSVPVIDLWAIIDIDEVTDRTGPGGGEDWDTVVFELVTASGCSEAIGWDRE